jgi:hypothetical protein
MIFGCLDVSWCQAHEGDSLPLLLVGGKTWLAESRLTPMSLLLLRWDCQYVPRKGRWYLLLDISSKWRQL